MGKRIAAAVAVLSLCACAHHGGGDDDGGGTYSSVRISPDPVTLAIPLGGTATQDYIVLGTDGSGEHDITSKCALDVDNNFGAFTNATLNATPHGGTTTVNATCNGTTGSGALTINLTGTAIVGNAPASSDQLFGTATLTTDMSHQPTIEYPIDQAVAPLNIPAIEIQYTKANNDLFHIHLGAAHANLDVYTTDPQNTFSEADWITIANTAVGDHLVITVEGLVQASPLMKYASTPVVFNLSHDTIDTSAIYWWASSQGSIMSQVFGQTTAPTAVKANCSGCHSLSRSGSRIGYSRCVNGDCNSNQGFLKYNATTQVWDEVVNADARAISGTYSTFAPLGNPFPDDSQAISMVTSMGGTFGLYDPDTGTAVPSNLAAVAPTTGHVTMPDWSPDGTKVAFVSGNMNGESVDVSGGSISTMSYAYANGIHTFGTAQALVQQPIVVNNVTYTNLFFPSFSPDGQQLVFNASRTAWRNSNAGQAAAPGQRLLLVNANGGAPVELAAMNGLGDHNVTWPHWAPGATTDYYWIVFSSERDYGHEITQANHNAGCILNGVKTCKQIWIGAISKAALMAGTVDPSFSPVWLPGQDKGADNISPFWTVPAGLF